MKPSPDPHFVLPVGRVNLGSLEIACESEIKKSNVWGDIEEETFIETGTFYGHGIISAILNPANTAITINNAIGYLPLQW